LKIIRDNTNTFPRRIWFEDREIEAIAEKHRHDFIHLMGKANDPAILVDKFIEIYLPRVLGCEIVFDPFANFYDAGEPDVLGETDFRVNRLVVRIERLITQGAERSSNWARYNTTVMHEAGHCILHRVLFHNDPNQEDLFSRPTMNKISCLQRTLDGYYTGEWWEFQANQFMANLLMPRELFLERFIKQRNAWHIHDNECLVRDYYELDDLSRVLAEVFGVSKQAAKLRLFELKQIPSPQQEKLFEMGSLNFGR
jgi:hypothetical protein